MKVCSLSQLPTLTHATPALADDSQPEQAVASVHKLTQMLTVWLPAGGYQAVSPHLG